MKYLKDEIFIKQVGKRIRQLRKQQNISQSQLAFESGIPINQIGRIERGEINTSIAVIYNIAKTLDINIKEIFNSV